MAYTKDVSLNLGPSLANLTNLRGQLLTPSGTLYGSEISSLFTHTGSGTYIFHYESYPDSFRGGIKFYQSGASSGVLAIHSINPEEFEYISLIKTQTDLLTSGGVTISLGSAVDSDGDVTIVRGDDYREIDARALEWTVSNAPSLVGSTCVFTARRGNSTVLTKSVTVVSATELMMELDTDDTTPLIPAEYKFDIQATLSNGNIVTVKFGTLTVTKDRTL
jgi:hypothetical protein